MKRGTSLASIIATASAARVSIVIALLTITGALVIERAGWDRSELIPRSQARSGFELIASLADDHVATPRLRFNGERVHNAQEAATALFAHHLFSTDFASLVSVRLEPLYRRFG
jgi:hypothetical protein